MQKNLDILTDLITSSSMTPRKKVFTIEILQKLINHINIQDEKLKKLFTEKWVEKKYKTEDEFLFDLDRMFICMETMGFDVGKLFIIPDRHMIWLSVNISAKDKVKMTAERYQQAIRAVELFEAMNARMPESMTELSKFAKENV
jgi:hypothetical protein